MGLDLQLTRVLCIGGHDPSSGAGIIADAEAVRAQGAFPLTVITALTEQDTCGLYRLHPQPPEHVIAHCLRLLDDSPPQALKIGLIGMAAIALALAELSASLPEVPIVLDPVLASGAGQSVADRELIAALRDRLIPCCRLIAPNLPEAQALSGAQAVEACAERLLELGVGWVLITGTHADTPSVVNRLFGADGSEQTWEWPRLAGQYHGSGCTLASAIAARLARGQEMSEAVAAAQEYTWRSLAAAIQTGRCQSTPNRLDIL
ncbi:hydroxymethylpyrimidine/phosphomethylpyrimidine kinase [Caldichromatium japonicum]|uniref:hydroxymethylpyrimidine kinase n=1 Tax=Caldichromatium japonicum TaxID=2699430 RepID=A0A6G7VFQ6_9GAMM|nr:hydroxymethylpyrimidine/phosphomethylpyrimidine kinase [Caldichromatium japonicum]QIK38627.1 hydroxymethylpyrimidine/phosphomethylpyrimidine kinase [Caldichromatium japonicum]